MKQIRAAESQEDKQRFAADFQRRLELSMFKRAMVLGATLAITSPDEALRIIDSDEHLRSEYQKALDYQWHRLSGRGSSIGLAAVDGIL